MEKVFYCKGWFRHRKRPLELWTEEQARTAYEARTPFTALVGSVDHPRCFVESGGQAVIVEFLDSHLRNYLSYVFDEVEPGLLFLQQLSRRFYKDDSDSISEAYVIYLKRDGTTKATRSFYDPPPLRHESGEGVADVSICYSPRPAFGNYEEVTREDRERPATSRTAERG